MAVDQIDSDDPRGKVISQFKVFFNDPSPRQVVVLQFPNRTRDQPYNAANHLKPTRIRWKPRSRFIEIEVPLDTQLQSYFNEERALKFGQHLSKNSLIQHGGSFGLAGGFGIGGISGRGGEPPKSDPVDDPNQRHESAEVKDDALRQLKLSGTIQKFQEGDFIYAMGTFKGDELHLTRVHALCSLSPHHVHLDAAVDNDRVTRSAESGATGPDARVINLAMRSNNVESGAPEDIGGTLRELQEEQWEELEWIDEDDNQAYCAFRDHLFYEETGTVEQLRSNMSSLAYRDAISASKPDNTTQRSGARLMDDWDESTDDDDSTVEIMQEEGLRRQIAID